MDVAAALEARRTVRAFEPRPVPRSTVRTILEAALRTPSWANTQPWDIWVADGDALERIRQAFVERTRAGAAGKPDLELPKQWPEVCRERTKALTAGRAKLAGVSTEDRSFQEDFVRRNRRFFGAPCVVYLCMDRSLTVWSVFDLGAMSQSIMLAAQEHGVDSAVAINLVFYPDVIREEMGIPDQESIVIGIALGYADHTHPADGFRSTRRLFDDAVRFAPAP